MNKILSNFSLISSSSHKMLAPQTIIFQIIKLNILISFIHGTNQIVTPNFNNQFNNLFRDYIHFYFNGYACSFFNLRV